MRCKFRGNKTRLRQFSQSRNLVTYERPRNIGIYEQVLVLLDNVFQFSWHFAEEKNVNAAFAIRVDLDLKTIRTYQESIVLVFDAIFHKTSQK